MNDTLQDFALLDNIEARIEELKRRKWWTSVPLTTFPASWLLEGEQRLDGGYYANETFATLNIIRKSGYPIKHLSELCKNIFHPPRFKRAWATEKEKKSPFLGGTEISHLYPKTDKFLSIKRTKILDTLKLEMGWILITCSGSIGRVSFVNETLNKFLVSQHVIRIVPNEDFTENGYLYAFLASRFGQALVQRNTYGSAILELEPHHLANIPVPILTMAH